MLIRCLLLLSLTVALLGCPSRQCTDQTCGGCCDVNDVCQEPSPFACGAVGNACVQCLPSELCRGGFCFQPLNGGGVGGGSMTGGGTGTGGGGSAQGGGGGGPTGGGTSDGGVVSLVVGCWNLEWFADPAQPDGGFLGPFNNALQQTNVQSVMRTRSDVDLWGIEEIVGTTEFSAVVAGLNGFGAVLATDVMAGTFYYAPTEQKVALVYRTSKVTVLGAKLILTTSSYDFAGRPPLEVNVQVNGTSFYVIVMHMKALADLDAYTRRTNSSNALKAYLDSTRANDKVMVIGDWNDDIDTSTYMSSASPFANFMADTAHYRFGTKELTDVNRRTSASSSATIDHQMFNVGLFSSYVTGTAAATIPSISNYTSTTSDHYPVTMRYQLR